MTQNTKNGSTSARKILDKLAEEKKKSATALCLITVMAVMWIRVFTKKTPQGAEAALGPDQVKTEDAPREEYRVSFVELPKVAGRNDVISRDFFASNGWQRFVDRQGRKPGGIDIVSTNGNEEVIRRVAEKLNLEGTIVGGIPQAYINGERLEIGRTLPIRDGADTYDCEVTEIEEYTVVIECKAGKFKLSIKP